VIPFLLVLLGGRGGRHLDEGVDERVELLDVRELLGRLGEHHELSIACEITSYRWLVIIFEFEHLGDGWTYGVDGGALERHVSFIEQQQQDVEERLGEEGQVLGTLGDQLVEYQERDLDEAARRESGSVPPASSANTDKQQQGSRRT